MQVPDGAAGASRHTVRHGADVIAVVAAAAAAGLQGAFIGCVAKGWGAAFDAAGPRDGRLAGGIATGSPLQQRKPVGTQCCFALKMCCLLLSIGLCDFAC